MAVKEETRERPSSRIAREDSRDISNFFRGSAAHMMREAVTVYVAAVTTTTAAAWERTSEQKPNAICRNGGDIALFRSQPADIAPPALTADESLLKERNDISSFDLALEGRGSEGKGQRMPRRFRCPCIVSLHLAPFPFAHAYPLYDIMTR
ncbi:hypothetical protein HN011_006118 [Eciton burchellii]|nr:hypothetical protein HN011_006118 [Eciton burchellii]